mgnify:CR=1 FL=1
MNHFQYALHQKFLVCSLEHHAHTYEILMIPQMSFLRSFLHILYQSDHR